MNFNISEVSGTALGITPWP